MVRQKFATPSKEENDKLLLLIRGKINLVKRVRCIYKFSGKNELSHFTNGMMHVISEEG